MLLIHWNAVYNIKLLIMYNVLQVYRMCMYIGVKYLDKHYTIHLYRLLISYNLDFFVLLLFLCTVISFELYKDIKKISISRNITFLFDKYRSKLYNFIFCWKIKDQKDDTYRFTGSSVFLLNSIYMYQPV